MKSRPVPSLEHWPGRLLSAPLRPGQFAAVGTVLVLIFTAYCQIYCAAAYHPMHGATMPARYSFAWAIGAVLPWLACFEMCKVVRASAAGSVGRYAGGAMWFVIAALLSIVMELGLDQLVSAHTRPLQMQVAAQIPSAAFVGLLLLLGGPARFGSHSVEETAGKPLTELLAIHGSIDWIEAAGNYVEVHAVGGTKLLRLTMRELEASLEPTAFVRIHRSTIVARAAIDARVLLDGSAAVRMRDGTLLKVGTRYAANLNRPAV